MKNKTSSLKYKARPAVIISNITYNNHSRGTVIIVAISSQIQQKRDMLLLDKLLNDICL